MKFELLHFYISPGHNFFGHHGQPAGEHPSREVPEIRCLAGRGIEGDRFLDHKSNHKGQITFFADEVYQSLCAALQVWDKPPSVLRRNVVTRGLDLNALIGVEFEAQGVRFFGVQECTPCYWMDRAFHSGAEEFLRGQGGLRARILTDGTLHKGAAVLTTLSLPSLRQAVPKTSPGLAQARFGFGISKLQRDCSEREARQPNRTAKDAQAS